MAGRILIMQTPPGDAPEWVRVLWVGASLPCEWKGVVGDHESLKGQALPSVAAYVVDQDAALKALGEKSPMAEKWWRDNGFPKPGKAFVFRKEDCHESKPVPQERILVADDMEMGFFELPGR